MIMKPGIYALCAGALWQTANAATFTVDTTSDAASSACTAAPNDCSLRGAITASDGVVGVDTIAFNIPMTDVGCVAATGICRITLGSVLTLINVSNVIIDGYTQPGAQPNTVPAESGGLNSVLKIEIVRSAGGSHSAFNTNSAGNTFTLRGVAIFGFSGVSAIGYVGGLGTSYQIEGNYLGIDANGNAVPVRNGIAIALSNSAHRIGGTLPAQRNLISNNDTGIVGLSDGLIIQGNLIGTNRAGTQAIPNIEGIRGQGGGLVVGGSVAGARNIISGNTRGLVTGGGLASAVVQGNYIGTDVSGSLPLSNATNGVELNNTPGNTAALIGGAAPAEANLIAFNGAQGVATRGARGRVNGNQMFGNAQLGIGNPGDSGIAATRRANDAGDADASSNNGQNFPEISAASFVGNSVNLSYRVDSTTVNAAYPLRIEFFKADGDEGRTFLLADSYLLAEALSIKNLTVPLPSNGPVVSDAVIVATATDANGNTSEFSFQPITMVIEQPVPSACGGNVRIFCDAFESDPQRSLEVTVRATSPLFKPNGNVRVSDSRGASCTLALAPTATALTGSGRCVLANSGAPGAITITAEYDTFSGAFGNVVTGGNVSQSSNFVIPSN
jgi:hypothetical protein